MVWRSVHHSGKLILVFFCGGGLLGHVRMVLFLVRISCILATSFCLWVFGRTGVALPTVGSSLAVMVQSRYNLYGWYFPDVLRNRQEVFVFVFIIASYRPDR